ncbi:3864_t:CDS:2, partial [Acaulospora colombiana]
PTQKRSNSPLSSRLYMEQASTSSGGQSHPFASADLSTIQTDEFVSNTSDHSDSDSDSVQLELEHEQRQAEKSDDEPGPPPFPLLNPFLFPGVRAPIEAYREMTLACRFIPTDQWLTTRVDRAWTVGQVKLHMLTKIWGGRRYQLSLSHTLRRPKRSFSQSQSQQPGHELVGLTSFSSSNYSSVVFAPSMMSEGIKSTFTFDNTINGSVPSLAQTIPPDTPDGGPGDNSAIGGVASSNHNSAATNGLGRILGINGGGSNAPGSSGAAAEVLLASPGKRSRRSMSTEGLRGRSTSSSSSRRQRSQSIGGSGKVTSSGG